MGVNLTAGASNVSFGLPDRPALNAAFMAMAMNSGLNSAITNPLEPAVLTAILAGDLFLGHDEYGRMWIKGFRKRGEGEGRGRRVVLPPFAFIQTTAAGEAWRRLTLPRRRVTVDVGPPRAEMAAIGSFLGSGV